MIREVIKKSIVWVVWKLSRKVVGNRIVCLHKQDDPVIFYNRMVWLAKNYAVVPLRILLKERRPYPMVALTFDDDETPPSVLPTLRELNLHATFFVNSDETCKWIRDHYNHRFEVGGHTYGHVDLGDVVDSKRLDEIIEPRELFAYPYGTPENYNPTVVDYLDTRYAIDYAFTCVPGWVDYTCYKYLMPRDALRVEQPEWYWRARLAGAYDGLYKVIHRRKW